MSITLTDINHIEEKKDLIKRTICKGSTDEELELFIHACKRTGLDPFMKQIYAVKRWSAADKREVMTMQTSIDGFRLIAERTGRYAPGKEPTFEYSDGILLSATSYVKKQTSDGTWHEVAASAYYSEYVQVNKEGKPSQFWQRMPHVMLSKCAEALALRKAFPAEMSGLYTTEEMGQADSGKAMPQPVQEEKIKEDEVELIVDEPLNDKQQATIDLKIRELDNPYGEKHLERLYTQLGISTYDEITSINYERVLNYLDRCIDVVKKKREYESSVA